MSNSGKCLVFHCIAGVETEKVGHVLTRKTCSYCEGTRQFIKNKCIECEATGQTIQRAQYL